jgi:hypothetical protein
LLLLYRHATLSLLPDTRTATFLGYGGAVENITWSQLMQVVKNGTDETSNDKRSMFAKAVIEKMKVIESTNIPGRASPDERMRVHIVRMRTIQDNDNLISSVREIPGIRNPSIVT